MSNPQKKRNFSIEAFKHKAVVDPKYADKTWKILEHAIHEIYNDNASSICFEDLYRLALSLSLEVSLAFLIYLPAYNMVLHGFGEKLYSGLATTMTAHVEEMSKSIEDAQGGLVGMLCGAKYEDLGRMYNLFRRVPNDLSTVRDVMTSHIRDIGKQLITDPERLKDPVEFVQWLLDEKDKYDKIISSAFNNDQTFQNALNSSFEYLINLNARSPEDKLRKGLEGIGKEDVEVILDKVVMLLRYLREKDVFEKYYEQH
ncbi:hypothetical protein NL676_032352 [Syzygium grande]|nr:hypothetical protein NL676_032352 [Syzygium grande]